MISTAKPWLPDHTAIGTDHAKITEFGHSRHIALLAVVVFSSALLALSADPQPDAGAKPAKVPEAASTAASDSGGARRRSVPAAREEVLARGRRSEVRGQGRRPRRPGKMPLGRPRKRMPQGRRPNRPARSRREPGLTRHGGGGAGRSGRAVAARRPTKGSPPPADKTLRLLPRVKRAQRRPRHRRPQPRNQRGDGESPPVAEEEGGKAAVPVPLPALERRDRVVRQTGRSVAGHSGNESPGHVQL